MNKEYKIVTEAGDEPQVGAIYEVIEKVNNWVRVRRYALPSMEKVYDSASSSPPDLGVAVAEVLALEEKLS